MSWIVMTMLQRFHTATDLQGEQILKSIIQFSKYRGIYYCKEIQPVHPKGDQSRVFFGRTDAEAETPVLWPPHAKSWLIGKHSDAGRDWGQEEKGTTEDEMAGWHHWLDAHEFRWTLGVVDGQGSMAYWESWGCKESDMTEWVKWTELNTLNIYLNKYTIYIVPQYSLKNMTQD